MIPEPEGSHCEEICLPTGDGASCEAKKAASRSGAGTETEAVLVRACLLALGVDARCGELTPEFEVLEEASK